MYNVCLQLWCESACNMTLPLVWPWVNESIYFILLPALGDLSSKHCTVILFHPRPRSDCRGEFNLHHICSSRIPCLSIVVATVINAHSLSMSLSPVYTVCSKVVLCFIMKTKGQIIVLSSSPTRSLIVQFPVWCDFLSQASKAF